MPTVDEINAGYVVLHRDLDNIIRTMVPEFYQGMAVNTVDQHKQLVINAVRDVLIAAERVRNANSPTSH